MPVAGIVVLTVKEKADRVLTGMQQIENVTTYGVHKENHIVAVLEGDNSRELETLSNRIEEIDGVLGVFPAYVSFEDEADETPEDEAFKRVVS